METNNITIILILFAAAAVIVAVVVLTRTILSLTHLLNEKEPEQYKNIA